MTDHACKYGHFDCSHTDGGPCDDERRAGIWGSICTLDNAKAWNQKLDKWLFAEGLLASTPFETDDYTASLEEGFISLLEENGIEVQG